MKLPCSIVKDLIPIYYENLVSDDSKAHVDEHLSECEDCKALLSKMQSGSYETPENSAAPLKKIKSKINRRRFVSILWAAVLSLTFAFLCFNYLAQPISLEYNENLFTFTEAEDGTVLYSINAPIAGSFIDGYADEDGNYTYVLTAWTSKLNEIAKTTHVMENAEITFNSGSKINVYYSENNGDENILIYGNADENTPSVTLMPRLALSNYWILAVAGAVLVGTAAFALRNRKEVKYALLKVMYVPATFAIACLLIRGFNFATYHLDTDLYAVLILMFPLYIVCILIEAIVRKKCGKSKGSE